MGLNDYSREEMQRMPMVELAHNILSDKQKAAHYSELYDQVAEMKGFTEEQKEGYLSQFYTDLTVDGRLITTGSGIWGLKRWYPVEQIDEEGAAPKKKKKKSTKKKATKKKQPVKQEEPESDDLEVLTDKFEDEVHDDEEDHFGDDFDDERDDYEDDEHDEDEEYEDDEEDKKK
ncbi:DNA-directed RNA polymerase subunit delta [Virgibacillus ihumii]|uniref:DNA-directed RNA polymerase subunit delta n=1 Tax=Virgibacillus ihumii TaxID=2686091 RepID=UPI00157C812E|nr:DNA-directed RNA polymerase subunit delta [Virgibacillus ihumii]